MRIHGAKQQREAVKRAPKNQLDPIFEVGFFFSFYVCTFESQFTVPSRYFLKLNLGLLCLGT